MQKCIHGCEATAASLGGIPPFNATLLPCRFLPRKGLRALLFNIAAMAYLSVIVFVIFGAGPLLILWCLDAALCVLVYRWRYAPKHLSESVELTEGKLCVTRIHRSGKEERFEFDPYWVRFEHTRGQWSDDELRISSHGREFVFGAFLSDDEKASFAAALSAALPRR